MSARKPSTEHDPNSAVPGADRTDHAGDGSADEYLDRIYQLLLDRCAEWTSNFGSAESASVCAVVRASRGRFLVGVLERQDLDSRYAVSFPLIATDGSDVNHVKAMDALRVIHANRQRFLEQEITPETLHGAPVIAGDGEVENTTHSSAVAESIYLTLRSMPTAPMQADTFPALRLHGFSYLRPGRLRIYLKREGTDPVIGVDVPIARTDETRPRRASANLAAELSALFREGVPANIADRESHHDAYCERLFDLTTWFRR